MFTRESYRVIFDDYAERHFIKEFEKKYKSAWLTTRRAIEGKLRNVDMLLNSGRLRNPPIHMSRDRRNWILKHEFAIAGLRESPHGSGRRIIAFVNENEKLVRVLLVYHKSHVHGGNETAWWERVVREEFGELVDIIA